MAFLPPSLPAPLREASYVSQVSTERVAPRRAEDARSPSFVLVGTTLRYHKGKENLELRVNPAEFPLPFLSYPWAAITDKTVMIIKNN